MSTQAATSSTWRCTCGYLNLGGRGCGLCGAAPVDAAAGAAPFADDRTWGELLRPSLGHATVGPSVVPAVLLATVVIAGNLGFQYGLRELVEDRGAAAGAYLAILGAGVFFFAVAAIGRLVAPDIRADRPRASRVDAALDGLVRGGIGVALAASLAWSLPGRSGIDPIAASVVDDGRIGLLVLTFLVVGLIGPIVEEYVFRGVVTEGLLRAEVRSAAIISSALFAMAHLSPVRFVYYFAMGMVFARLYLRRGLLASTVAHITLNAGILVIAVLVLHGGATPVTAGSIRFELPSRFHSVPAPAGDTFAAVGPAGTTIEIGELALPPGSVFDPDTAADLLAMYPVVNDLQIHPGTSHVRLTPFGNGVEATIGGGADGRTGVVVLVASGDALHLFAAHSDGDERAARDALERVLASVSPAD